MRLRLRKALWTAYWRGTDKTRELIEESLSPTGPSVRRVPAKPDATAVAAEVAEFVTLANEGAYMGRDRRVSRQERSKWRHTFRAESHSTRRQCRTADLAEWHRLLIEQLMGTDHEDHLDRLVSHSTLSGPELTFFQAQLAVWRGNHEEARTLIQKCCRALPGHTEFKAFAEEVGA